MFRSRRSRALAITCTTAALAPMAHAGLTYQTTTTGSFASAVTLNHQSDAGALSVGSLTVNVAPPLPASGSLPTTFQLNNNYVSGSTSSTGKATLGHVTNSTTASFTLAPGTGVTQSDPSVGGTLGSYSETKLTINNMYWQVSAGDFTPASAYVCFTVGGSLATNATASASYNITLRRYASLGGSLLETKTLIGGSSFSNATGTTPTFGKTFISSSGFSPSTVPAGQAIRMTGTVTFRAAATPSSVPAPYFAESVDAQPPGDSTCDLFDIDAGFTQPTWHFANALLPQPLNWTNTDAWLDAEQPTFTFPNGPGIRARFGNDGGTNRQIVIDQPITLGTLDVDGSSSTSILPRAGAAQTLTFDDSTGSPVPGSTAVINHRNVAGQGALLIANPMRFDVPMQINVDSSTGTTINGDVTSAIPNNQVSKTGPGKLTLNVPLAGMTLAVGEGTVILNTDQAGSVFPSATNLVVSPLATSAATVLVNSDQNLASLLMTGNAQVKLSPVTPLVLSTGSFSMPALPIIDQKLDLGRGSMVATATPFATLRDLVISGRNGGNWAGNGITSSVVAASPILRAVGIVDTGASVVLKATLVGDTDLDGTVDLADFSALASGFNMPGTWATGDFDYSGNVNLTDFSLLAATFGLTFGDLPRPANVPEPTRIPLAAVAAISLTRRRRDSVPRSC